MSSSKLPRKPREWVYVEHLVPADKQDAKAVASKKSLQAVLDKLNPAAGKQSARGPGMDAKPKKKARKKKRGGLGSLSAK